MNDDDDSVFDRVQGLRDGPPERARTLAVLLRRRPHLQRPRPRSRPRLRWHVDELTRVVHEIGGGHAECAARLSLACCLPERRRGAEGGDRARRRSRARRQDRVGVLADLGRLAGHQRLRPRDLHRERQLLGAERLGREPARSGPGTAGRRRRCSACGPARSGTSTSMPNSHPLRGRLGREDRRELGLQLAVAARVVAVLRAGPPLEQLGPARPPRRTSSRSAARSP